jgi:predicted nucleic acid-binding protein
VPVVDASIVVDVVAPGRDADGQAVQLFTRLAESGAALLAPRLLLEETGNALLTGIRRGRWSGAAADASFTLLRRLPVELVDDERDLDRAWDLARRYDAHPIYDMLYAAVAVRRGEALITADRSLLTRLSPLDLAVAPGDYR